MRRRDIFILLGAIAAALAVAITVFSGSVLETGSWGLSYRQSGTPPVGNAGADQLRQYDAAYIGDTTQPTIYLTFDAGYENGCTGKILDVLKKQEVPAAFFLVGHYIEKNADLVRRMADEGHIVANHTMHHFDMSKLKTEEAFAKELTDLETLYKETTGQDMKKFYRPPQGIYSEENLKMAQKLWYKKVLWSLAYADWDDNKQMSPQNALELVESRVHNGCVALLHPTSSTNAKILGDFIKDMKAKGYEFCSLADFS